MTRRTGKSEREAIEAERARGFDDESEERIRAEKQEEEMRRAWIEHRPLAVMAFGDGCVILRRFTPERAAALPIAELEAWFSYFETLGLECMDQAALLALEKRKRG